MNPTTTNILAALIISSGLLFTTIKFNSMKFHEVMETASTWITQAEVAAQAGCDQARIANAIIHSRGESGRKRIGEKGQNKFCTAAARALEKKIVEKQCEIKEIKDFLKNFEK